MWACIECGKMFRGVSQRACRCPGCGRACEYVDDKTPVPSFSDRGRWNRFWRRHLAEKRRRKRQNGSDQGSGAARWGVAYPLSAIGDTFSSVVGWTAVVVLTIVAGFVPGYWIGHRQIMSWQATGEALAWVPVAWLGCPWVLVAYATTALAWYVPMRIESIWLRVVAAAVNWMTWVGAVAVEVERCSHGKFYQW